ncbi:MAG: bifunctional [glutamate--ammonia ligase]-adenylyl-L-tyrosine phosphorylase/[glutamate--ammonia-ligase] adenylyltransferase [Burkholderiales bacterium]
MNRKTRNTPAEGVVDRTLRLSRYVRHLVDSGACALDAGLLDQPFARDQMAQALAGPFPGEDALKQALRKLRQAVLLRIIGRDLNGRADLQEVVATVTALAEETISASVGFYFDQFTREYGTPVGATGTPQTLHVIGMGKLGGGELNVSSDVDLIFAYPEDGETGEPRHMENNDFFTRIARKLVAALSELTADGFVFRVDTRLRPYGDSGPLVGSFDMLEEYFYSQGREWERYAWVKARVVAGDRADELYELASPFVFRRHLDFSALKSLRDLHAQIRAEVNRRDIADNIKLGRGGIREIEFVVQVFQLIRGGREPALRLRPTLAALGRLGRRGLLPEDAVTELRDAYVFLRNLEHRLQYLDDRQTQTLPESEEDRALIAEGMGFADHSGFSAALETHRRAVSRHFDAIFAASRDDAPNRCAEVWLQVIDQDDAAERLHELGYSQPGKLVSRLASLREGHGYRRMSASGQARLDELIPQVIEAAAQYADPRSTLERMLMVIESIGRRESYLALLIEFPQALAALARLASASPWAAEYLARQPVLLDELILPPEEAAPDWNKLRAELRTALDGAADNTERQMDLLRNFKHAQTFRLLTFDLAGTLPLETLSDHLSDLASLILAEVLHEAWTGLRARHREQPKFAVIGYGKLGGKELGYASDLDIIFLYDEDDTAAQETYARLAQRVNTWLTSVTSAGVLYDTDLRLRPNGAAGLLVSSLDAFREYQRTKAWVWEHQALTRARFVAGDAGIGAEFEKTRGEVLRMPRDRKSLKQDVAQMRQKMRDSHPNTSDLFDVKHDPGGIVDVEFAVQYLVLAYASEFGELTGNIGNLALLRLATRLGLLPEEKSEAAHAAYREFRRLQHALRLQGERYARLPHEAVASHTRAVIDLWDWIFETDQV